MNSTFKSALRDWVGRVLCGRGWHSWRSSVVACRECSRCRRVELLRVGRWVSEAVAARFDAAMEEERQRATEILTCPCPYNYTCIWGVCAIAASKRLAALPSEERERTP